MLNAISVGAVKFSYRILFSRRSTATTKHQRPKTSTQTQKQAEILFFSSIVDNSSTEKQKRHFYFHISYKTSPAATNKAQNPTTSTPLVASLATLLNPHSAHQLPPPSSPCHSSRTAASSVTSSSTTTPIITNSSALTTRIIIVIIPSSFTSQSFDQRGFPLPTSPLYQQPQPDPQPEPETHPKPMTLQFQPLPPPIPFTRLQELFHLAELQVRSGSESDQLAALYLLERSLVPNPSADQACQPELMRGLVVNFKNKAGAKPATKILLVPCLAENNRHVAVEAEAVGAVIWRSWRSWMGRWGRERWRHLNSCTVAKATAKRRWHKLAVPAMVTMMGQTAERGKEYVISVLTVIDGGGDQLFLTAPPEEMARAVALTLQGDCTARERRKGTQLLKAVKEYGRLDLTQDEN